ncbi:MAG: exonuclease SbcCD subunit D [Burkholderiaceae bacterium]
MRLLHTADWHLGRVFHGRSLLDDQAAVLDELVRMVRDTRPDAVLVAGDIYDRSIPPADAVRLLDETLTRIVADLRTPVFLIAGNHDGPDRLSFGARLMAGAGLRVEAVPVATPGASVLADAAGEVEIFALPYAEPPMMRNVLGADADIPDHAAVLAAQMAAVRRVRDPARRLVVMAHAFVAGGIDSESERPLVVGTAASVPAAVFDDAHYVALGHLHRPQRVGREAIRYAGSLMKYSFSEASHIKGATLVELDGAGAVRAESLPLPAPRDLRIIEGRLAELLAAAPQDPRRDDYLLCRLTDTGALLDAMPRLRAVHPNALAIERPLVVAAGGPAAATRHARIELIDLFGSFVADLAGEPLDESDRAFVAERIAALEREEREAEP